jgi:hypothetical protein
MHTAKQRPFQTKSRARNCSVNYGKSSVQFSSVQNKNSLKKKYITHKKSRPKTVCGIYLKTIIDKSNGSLNMSSNKLLKFVEAKLEELKAKKTHNKK